MSGHAFRQVSCDNVVSNDKSGFWSVGCGGVGCNGYPATRLTAPARSGIARLARPFAQPADVVVRGAGQYGQVGVAQHLAVRVVRGRVMGDREPYQPGHLGRTGRADAEFGQGAFGVFAGHRPQQRRRRTEDRHALGLQPSETQPTERTTKNGEVSEADVWNQLKQCYDPEIPVNIVDLGLVYDCKLAKKDDGGTRVEVKMTLTAPGCGMGPAIAHDAQSKILTIDGVDEADVQLVWDPPWNQNMISEAGRMKLGML